MSKIQQFRKKPEVVEVLRINKNTSTDEIREFSNAEVKIKRDDATNAVKICEVIFPHGKIILFEDDYLVKYSDGNFHSYNGAHFLNDYEAV